jgi:hypothetical protein
MSEASTSAGLRRRASPGHARVAGPVDLDEATRALMATLHRRLRQRFGERLKGLFLFGSRALGDHSADSDADVAVMLAGPIGKTFAIKSAIIDDTYDLFLESGILIQPWPLEQRWLENPELSPYPHIVASVRREGVDL